MILTMMNIKKEIPQNKPNNVKVVVDQQQQA
jgi:CMP-2-keto-3-deoxyoctulosonic acid synthetase